MTLEEAIKFHKADAKNQRDKAEYWTAQKEHSVSKSLYERWARECIECAEDNEQIAEWLQQLLVIKTIAELPVYSQEDIARYKAIQAVFNGDSDE